MSLNRKSFPDGTCNTLHLHVHSCISPCSNLCLEDIIHQAQEKGLDGLCITDHDTMTGGQWITEGVQENGLVVIIGQEYTTRQGDFLLFGAYELKLSLLVFY